MKGHSGHQEHKDHPSGEHDDPPLVALDLLLDPDIGPPDGDIEYQN